MAPISPTATKSAEWNRGAYLVEGLAHCGACHTPRNALGAEKARDAFAGGDVDNWHAYAINSQSPAPVPWDADALFGYLRQGWHPDHGVARGPMAQVVGNLSEVPESDVRAIATYMADVFGAPTPDRKRRGDDVLAQAASRPAQAPQASNGNAARRVGLCRGLRDLPCQRPGAALWRDQPRAQHDHQRSRRAQRRQHRAFRHPSRGRRAQSDHAGFADSMSDDQIAALLDYLRARFSNQPPWTNTADIVRECQADPDRPFAEFVRARQRPGRRNQARQAMMTLKVNGQDHQVDADPDTPLLYVLRDDLKLNAAKFGCGLGQCGACTVIVDGKAVLSCVTPLVLLEGKKVTTLEGLGTIEAPAPIQRAFIEEQAAQCGYCIAGMMMRAQALLQRNSKPTDAQIRAELELNLCRCGTHMRILRAVHRAGQLMQTADASPARRSTP